MEDLKILISVVALGLGVWNFFRLQNLDLKGEYKDKRYLYQECLNEAKELIEKVDSGLHEIELMREEYTFLDSPYKSSGGAQQGHEALMKKLSEIHEVRNIVITLYKSLNDVVSLEDKEAFDQCIDTRTQIKECFISVGPLVGEAKRLMDRMIKFCNVRKHA